MVCSLVCIIHRICNHSGPARSKVKVAARSSAVYDRLKHNVPATDASHKKLGAPAPDHGSKSEHLPSICALTAVKTAALCVLLSVVRFCSPSLTVPSILSLICCILLFFPQAASTDAPGLCAAAEEEPLPQKVQNLEAKLSDLLQRKLESLEDYGTSHEEAAASQRLVMKLGIRECLERFLQARNNSLEHAETMFRDVVRWRAQVADKVFDEPRALQAWKAVSPYWMSKAHVARDALRGPTPVTYTRLAYLLPLYVHFEEDQLTHAYTRFMEQSLHLQVQAFKERQQKATSNIHAPQQSEVPRVIEIFDMKGVGLAHLRCVVGIKMLARVLGVGQAFYPENMDRAFVLNAPRFAEIGFRIVTNALHENTRKKIVITHEDNHPDLQMLIGQHELESLRSSVPPFPDAPSDPTKLYTTVSQPSKE